MQNKIRELYLRLRKQTIEQVLSDDMDDIVHEIIYDLDPSVDSIVQTYVMISNRVEDEYKVSTRN